ncbi:unnamed protein product [Lampetra fluviatilis]
MWCSCAGDGVRERASAGLERRRGVAVCVIDSCLRKKTAQQAAVIAHLARCCRLLGSRDALSAATTSLAPRPVPPA